MLNTMIHNFSLLVITAFFLTAGNAVAADLKTVDDTTPTNASELITSDLKNNLLRANSNNEENQSSDQFPSIVTSAIAQPAINLASSEFNTENTERTEIKTSIGTGSTQLNEFLPKNLDQRQSDFSQADLFSYNNPIIKDGGSLPDGLQVPAYNLNAALKSAIADINLSTSTATLNKGTLLTPIIVVNGSKDALFDNNTFSLEDLANGGDLDYNDIIVKVNLQSIGYSL